MNFLVAIGCISSGVVKDQNENLWYDAEVIQNSTIHKIFMIINFP